VVLALVVVVMARGLLPGQVLASWLSRWPWAGGDGCRVVPGRQQAKRRAHVRFRVRLVFLVALVFVAFLRDVGEL
jgi:hypothetical protein